MNKIYNDINLLNIVCLLYSDFRYINIFYEDLDLFFENDIQELNIKYINNFTLSLTGNILQYTLFGPKDYIILLNLLKDGFLIKEDYVNSIDYYLDYIPKNTDLYKLMILLKESRKETGDDLFESVKYFENKSFLIFNVLNSVFKTFRGRKDLMEANIYITRLINKYNLSIFYLFRVRNTFLYYYQVVLGRDKFYFYLFNNKTYILNSKYIKLVFSDLIKARNSNFNNEIIYLFEGVIYLHLLNSKGVELLRKIENKGYEDIPYWISNYYLDIGEYDLSLKELYKSNINKNFKYYRKLIATYIGLDFKSKILLLIEDLKLDDYELGFYIQGKNDLGIKTYSHKDCISNNENLNIILDIRLIDFISIVNKNMKLNELLSILLNYVRKNHRNFFLKDDDISIILKKIGKK